MYMYIYIYIYIHIHIYRTIIKAEVFGWQCVAVCCRVLQCVAVCCNTLQCVLMCCKVWQCVAMCCSLLQHVAVCCRVWQCVAVCCSVSKESFRRLTRIGWLCKVSVQGCSRMTTHTAKHCNALQHTTPTDSFGWRLENISSRMLLHDYTHRNTLQHTTQTDSFGWRLESVSARMLSHRTRAQQRRQFVGSFHYCRSAGVYQISFVSESCRTHM